MARVGAAASAGGDAGRWPARAACASACGASSSSLIRRAIDEAGGDRRARRAAPGHRPVQPVPQARGGRAATPEPAPRRRRVARAASLSRRHAAALARMAPAWSCWRLTVAGSVACWRCARRRARRRRRRPTTTSAACRPTSAATSSAPMSRAAPAGATPATRRRRRCWPSSSTAPTSPSEACALYRRPPRRATPTAMPAWPMPASPARGVAKDEKQALQHFSKAAELGHAWRSRWWPRPG
ncbi:MAG: SEL1-like repeat protein [Marinilabiliales bacterium]|nr:SEL1-like repeat protein [Marinilabiliales bacterium]